MYQSTMCVAGTVVRRAEPKTAGCSEAVDGRQTWKHGQAVIDKVGGRVAVLLNLVSQFLHRFFAAISAYGGDSVEIENVDSGRPRRTGVSRHKDQTRNREFVWGTYSKFVWEASRLEQSKVVFSASRHGELRLKNS